jgi:hypothetical protein
MSNNKKGKHTSESKGKLKNASSSSSSSSQKNISSSFTLKKKNDPNYIDVLDEDDVIAGQKFVCVSFISPEKILKQKENFFFEHFLKKWDFNKSMEKFVDFLNFISFKYRLDFDHISADLKDFVEEEKKNMLALSVEDEYKTFLDKEEEELEKEFAILHNFQTNTRGLKIRGVYATQEEAELRCKFLREYDPNHDIYVAPVGLWVPYDPDAYKTNNVEYLEPELNQLMHEKQKNETQAKLHFKQRVMEAKQKAMEENMKTAEKSGNVLTQTIDASGNLVGINTLSSFKDAMFEASNIDMTNLPLKNDA